MTTHPVPSGRRPAERHRRRRPATAPATASRCSTRPPDGRSPRIALAGAGRGRRRGRGRPASVPRLVAGDPGGARRPRCTRWPPNSTAMAGELADVETAQTGKPLRFSTDFDVAGTIDNAAFFAGAARVLEGSASTEYSPDHTSSIRREAIGVVGSIAPWNYPLQMAGWKILPAIAAGNTIVLKPAEITPLTAVLMARAARRAGIPDGVVNVVTGTGAVAGDALVGHPGRRHGQLHRVHRGRPPGDGPLRRARRPGAPRAGRQGAVRGLRRRRPGGGGARRGGRQRDQHRAGLHRGNPGLRARLDPGRLRRRRRRPVRRDPAR